MVDGTAYPGSGSAPNGVYLPWYTDAQGHKVYGGDPANGGNGAAGGFYINGNASLTLSATGGNGNPPTQTYTITTQDGASTTIVVCTTCSVNNSAGTTTVSSGSNTLTLQGIPSQLDPNSGQPIIQKNPSGNPVNPTLVYVNGQITGLSGTVQNNTGITIVAPNGVNITGNVTYLQSPVSIPADVLDSSTNAGVLGVYTTGNINLNADPNSNGNLTVDGSLAAIGQNCPSNSCGFTASGHINTFNNVGGQIQTNIFSADMNVENTYFDRRFNNSFGPPWFVTAQPQPGTASVPAQQFPMTVTRTSWQELNR